MESDNQFKYDIVFAGELVVGAELESVKEKAATLFGANQQTVNRLFSGNRVVIKSNLDAAQANQYVQALEQSGMIVEKLLKKPPVDAVPQDSLPVADPSHTSKSAQQEQLAAVIQPSAPGWEIMPVGSTMSNPVTVEPLNIDLSHVSLADLGADIISDSEVIDHPVPVEVKTDHLQIVPTK